MKKAILIMLAALMLVSSLTACGNKKADYDEDGYSRVLYDDSDQASSEDEETDEEEQSEESEQTDTNEESSTDTATESEESDKIASRASETDSDKKKSTSSKSSSTVSTVKSTAKTSSGSNNAAAESSKSSTTGGSSSKASVSYASSSETSTDTNTDTSTDSDTDSSTDTEWFDSENDSDVNSDTDSEIEKGTFEVSDMSFPINGDSISVGGSFEEADELLGGPNESYGNVYYYNECKITTNGDEEDEIITNITITSAQYPIAKDIRIGSTTDDLLRAFGDAEYGYTYTLVDRILNFVVIDDEIIEISFS